MAVWDTQAWDNDDAADWFASMMETSRLPARIAKALSGDVMRKPEIARAACWLLVQLRRGYVWPIERLDADLEAGIAALAKLKTHETFDGVEQRRAIMAKPETPQGPSHRDEVSADAPRVATLVLATAWSSRAQEVVDIARVPPPLVVHGADPNDDLGVIAPTRTWVSGGRDRRADM